MPFRFHMNMLSQASRAVAATVMVVGMLLIGFAMIIAALPEIFAYLAAAVFFLVGLASIIFAIRMFWAQHRLDKSTPDDVEVYRENVRIHRDEFHDS